MFPAVRPPVRFCARTFLSALFVGLLAALPIAVRAAGAPEVIRIGTLPGLRFDTASFSVRPGAQVELVFSNNDEMLHNLVVVKSGTREAVVQAALVLGAGATERNYVPDSTDVLWATPIVPQGQSFSLRISNAALRTLDFKGGLDPFIVKAKDEQLSTAAQRIKRQVKAKLAEQAAA